MLSNPKKGTSMKFEELIIQRAQTLQTMRGKTNYSIDFDDAYVIDKGNYRVRKTLESWHIAKTVDAKNNPKQLPRQYSILL